MKKTKINKLDSFNKWKQNPSKGEVFTPKELVNEILDQIPVEVWKNPKSTFCDLSMGKGTFLVEIVNRLVYIYGYKEEDAKSRVFGYEIRVKYVNYLKRRGYKNVFHKDGLIEYFNMKFDVVLGNPPYTIGKNNPIWHKFVDKAFEICKEGGYISLIHPNGWRNISGRFKEVQKKIKSKKCLTINMFDINKGKEIFGVDTPFDWYIIKNVEVNEKFKTKIIQQNNKIQHVEIYDMEFIPNFDVEIINNLIAGDGGDTVEILHSESMYEIRKPYMSISKNDEYKYPCVYSVLKDGTFTLRYSNIKKGFFGVSKLILGNGANPTCFIDSDGKYGMTQFTFGIVEDPENLEKLKKVLTSKIFEKITKSTKYVATAGNPLVYPKIISTFKKDFWRHFLDENNNVIEPNFENVERV
jgi:predicted RNA methylase